MKKIRLVLFVLAVIGIFLSGILPDKSKAETGILNGPEYIKIATFNIYRWGQTKEEKKDLRYLAKLINEFDLIAIQEVMPQHGAEQVNRLMSYLNNEFKARITPKTGNNKYSEMYAYIYNADRIEFLEQERFIIPNPMDNEFFNRVPHMAYFKAGNFDFWLVNVHLLWGSYEKDRSRETHRLARWIKEYLSQRVDENGEQDLIIVGDFNRYGKSWKSFDEFLFENWKKYYRILTLEPDSNLKTNSARSVHKTYDNIFISIGAVYEFEKDLAVIDKTVGVVPWDESGPWKKMHLNDIKIRISDHRPVWALFRIDQPDDDEVNFPVQSDEFMVLLYHVW